MPPLFRRREKSALCDILCEGKIKSKPILRPKYRTYNQTELSIEFMCVPFNTL